MSAAEIAASLRLTEHGRRMAAAGGWGAAARLAFSAAASDPDDRAAEVARALRRCPSIVAVPANFGPLPNGARVVQLHALRAGGYTDAGGIATLQIPARHLEAAPTPRELAKTIAGLLA